MKKKEAPTGEVIKKMTELYRQNKYKGHSFSKLYKVAEKNLKRK